MGALKDRNSLWVGEVQALSRTTSPALVGEAIRWGIQRPVAEEVDR